MQAVQRYALLAPDPGLSGSKGKTDADTDSQPQCQVVHRDSQCHAHAHANGYPGRQCQSLVAHDAYLPGWSMRQGRSESGQALEPPVAGGATGPDAVCGRCGAKTMASRVIAPMNRPNPTAVR